MLIGFILFAGVGVLRDEFPSPFLSALSAAGFVLCFGALIYMRRRLRCPNCYKPIENPSGNLSTAIARYCPHCGVDLATFDDTTTPSRAPD
jgi:hypothetical protein